MRLESSRNGGDGRGALNHSARFEAGEGTWSAKGGILAATLGRAAALGTLHVAGTVSSIIRSRIRGASPLPSGIQLSLGTNCAKE